MIPVLGHGVYSYAETAHITGVSPRRVRAWFKGWPATEKWGGSRGVLAGDYRDIRSKSPLVSFLDLVDVLAVGRLREHMPMNKVKLVYKVLGQHLQAAHPFSRQEFLADGSGKLLCHIIDQAGESTLIEVISKQVAFPELLLPFLKHIDFDPKTHLAMRLKLWDGVVIDPRYKYGKPILLSNGMPTSIVAQAYRANNRDADSVASWYRINAEEVLRADEFESRFSGLAA